MATLLTRVSFTLLVMETFVGIVANGFIALINYIDWFKSRKLSPNDLILSCLGLSRLAWQTVVFLDTTLHFFSLGNRTWYLMIAIMWIFTNTTNIWFGTWLSVFYFAKIAIFSHPVFLRMKQRISGLVPWLLLGSAVFSAVMTIIIVTSLSQGLFKCDLYTSYLTVNDSGIKIPDACIYVSIVLDVPNVIPCLIFLSASILLITSLRKHTRRLQRNGTGTPDLNSQVHLTAIKALASFSVLYMFSFVANTLQTVLFWKNRGYHRLLIPLNNVVAAYPSGHAIILILMNPRLKQAGVGMLRRFKCCSSDT